MAISVENRQDRLGAAQVDAMFDFILVAAVAAAAAAAILAGGLVALGQVEPRTAAAWVAYILACALANLVLRALHRRSSSANRNWRAWGLAFSLVNLGVGLGFGWAPIGLPVGGRADVVLLVLIDTLCMAAGAITAFGPYLPTFAPFFLAATLPFAISGVFASDPLLHGLAPVLMLIFIGGMGGLGLRANLAFAQLVRFQIETEELAQDLQRQKEIAERANLAKSTFLAAASHDLRQPVHALGLFVGALRSLAVAEDAASLIDQIESSVNAMDGLFGALLDVSRLDAGVVAVDRRALVIQSILARACGDCAPQAEAKGVRLDCVGSSALVDSDPVLLERIVRNLVSNAVRYTERGRVLVGCRRARGALVVQVWDTGVGIAAGERERIFQEYYQIGNPERDRAKGLGLGLAIVRRLAVLLGAELTLRSEQGKGSCFAIAVPLATGPASPLDPVEHPLARAAAGRLVVVVDDEAPIREGMAKLLASWGYDVVAEGSGDEAIARLAALPTRPDLFVCDYRLRGAENGLDLIERLRGEYNAAIAAILLTGDTAPDLLSAARARDLIVLHKPAPLGKLRAAIANAIAAGEPDEETDA